jgi:hypothetical protein
LGALLSLDEIETIQNLSVILHDSRSTLQGIRAKTISIYLTSEALYVNQEYENVSLSNEMAIIKTILDNRTVDNVTIMIPEAPDMAAVPVIKSLYAGFHDDDELELNSGNTVQRLKQGTSVNRRGMERSSQAPFPLNIRQFIYREEGFRLDWMCVLRWGIGVIMELERLW